MPTLDRVRTNVNCCGIEVAFNGNTVPSTIEGWQPFYNETFTEADFQKAYSSIASISFFETSATINGNTSYKQKVEFRFPANDQFRAERIALLHTIKFIKVKLNTGKDIVIGRNDVFQNTLPSTKYEGNQQTAAFTLEVQSIAPAGFTPNINQYGLPSFIPLSF
jgi:hypothetical protein